MAPDQLFGQRFQRFGGRGFVHEMETGLAGFFHDLLDPVGQLFGGGGFIAADVVQAHVAEAAFFPVAAVRHGELVPAAVAPQAVHGVEHVEQAQVFVQRQAVPGGRAHVFKGNVGLGQVGVFHCAVVPHKGALQALAPTLALQVLNQREQWALARIERHVVHKVKHARVAQLTQFGVHKTAAQRHGDSRVVGLDGLGDAKGGVHRAGKGHRQQHQLRLVPLDGGQGQVAQQVVHQRGRRGQRMGQRVKRGLAAGQRLGVAHKFKALVHRVAQHVGQVVQIQRAQVARFVLHAERAKGPGQRVAAAVVCVCIERGKTWAFSQQAARGDAVGQGRVAALQVGHDGADGAAVGGELVQEGVHAGAALGLRQGVGVVAHSVQPGGREQLEHEGERQVFLHGVKTARAQKAGEVSGGRVGRVELRHRGDEAQHAEVGGHGRLGLGAIPGA